MATGKQGIGSGGIRKLLTFLISLTILLSSVLAQGRKLSNEDIIKMTKAELPEEVIVKTIQTNENRFDLSPDGLIALKAAKAHVLHSLCHILCQTSSEYVPQKLITRSNASRSNSALHSM